MRIACRLGVEKGSFTYDVITEGEGGSFQMMTTDDGGGRGAWPMMTSAKIVKFLDDF